MLQIDRHIDVLTHHDRILFCYFSFVVLLRTVPPVPHGAGAYASDKPKCELDMFLSVQLTWADLYFLCISDLSMLGEGANSVIDNYAKLKVLREKVSTTPNVAAWLAKRPKTNF